MTMPIHNSQFTIRYSLLKNPNTRWAWEFVSALAQAGLTAVSIAPGSRSTPLTLAFHAHPDITVYPHLDERSAGFFALGMALARDKPTALVCSSGTAVANLLPALIEAKMSHVPLLALTADRPHELRHSGANQTIDQVKIYGDQVLWSVDMPVPHSDAPEVILRHVQTLAARAYATANGITKGPVHVNFPFRKPLQPVDREPLSVNREPLDEHGTRITEHGTRITEHGLRNTDYGIRIQHGRLLPTNAQLAELTAVISQHPRGLIVCGPRCPGGEFATAVITLAAKIGWPILADPLSGVRFSGETRDWRLESTDQESPITNPQPPVPIIGGYETFLQAKLDWPEPQVTLRFGATPTSKWLNAYLGRIRPAHRIHIRANGVWADDSHRTTWFLQANETAVCQELVQRLSKQTIREWETAVRATEAAVWRKLEAALQDVYFDGAIVYDVVNALPNDSVLFMGNSLSVRHLDQFGRPSAKRIRVFANRGASGIDGNLSTALGIAAATGKPVTAVLGDITFYHDMNGLLPITNYQLPITIIVINNNGGGIFRRLPISQHEPPFTEMFLTPHGLEFEHAARLYGLDYIRVDNRAAFGAAISQPAMSPRLIEVVTDGRSDHKIRLEILSKIEN